MAQELLLGILSKMQSQGFELDGGREGIAQEFLFRDIIANAVTVIHF